MLELRADPWDPGYGMGFDAPEQEELSGRVDPLVETQDWRAALAGAQHAVESLYFVDGVLRVEVRVIAQEDGRRTPGLFGSFAAGCVHSDGTATFGPMHVGRAVVLGGGLRSDELRVPAGTEELRFAPVAENGTDPNAPRLRLQQVMRDAETRLATDLAREEGVLVLTDGPLTYVDPSGAPVVGVVKRFAKHYLEGEHADLLARLHPGQRTPLFGIAIAEQPVHRYSWYTRLAPIRAPWHDHAGLVRCEAGSGLGLEGARALADRVSALLPAFAGRSSDPRAPQNLAPIGALESRLRHRMGDHRKIYRAITAHLTNQGGDAWTS